MATEDPWQGGAHVRVVGLVNAAQHNGKLGTLDKKTGDRWGVLLDERAFGAPRLAVKESNLELVEPRCFRTTAAVADRHRRVRPRLQRSGDTADHEIAASHREQIQDRHIERSAYKLRPSHNYFNGLV